MKLGRAFIFGLARAAAIAVGLGLLAAGYAAAEPGGRVPVPEPAKGRGENCVADTQLMRRNHMNLLKHQRKDTVHEGVRTETFSLKGCIDCHAVEGPDAKPVGISSPQHFCRTCHDYAAVQIDCFECHASKPGEADKTTMARPHDADVAALSKYLEGQGQ
ncbi:MAG: hypothetical protein KDJ16_13190 [Hyphomicrobiales bacterium]|nr:hypothetical protein [Hyphomicrobiales bacterium]